jgi:RNA polymerase sigma-70 factor (ECF subfamily)
VYARSNHQVTDDGYASFFRERFSRTVVLLVVMGASRADAEDATQEAMVRAWQKWKSIQNPGSWVRTVAYRAYLRQIHARERQTVPLDESACEPLADSDLSIFTDGQRVVQLLRALPPGQRTVAAFFYDGLTCEEIADLVSKPVATIRSQLRHARTALKEMMNSEG